MSNLQKQQKHGKSNKQTVFDSYQRKEKQKFTVHLNISYQRMSIVVPAYRLPMVYSVVACKDLRPCSLVWKFQHPLEIVRIVVSADTLPMVVPYLVVACKDFRPPLLSENSITHLSLCELFWLILGCIVNRDIAIMVRFRLFAGLILFFF